MREINIKKRVCNNVKKTMSIVSKENLVTLKITSDYSLPSYCFLSETMAILSHYKIKIEFVEVSAFSVLILIERKDCIEQMIIELSRFSMAEFSTGWVSFRFTDYLCHKEGKTVSPVALALGEKIPLRVISFTENNQVLIVVRKEDKFMARNVIEENLLMPESSCIN